MKTWILTIAFCFSILFANADGSPIMVCNPSGTACAPFTNIDTAYSYANPGDYIYLPGGIFILNVVIAKEIHMIGAGHHFDSSMVTNFTTINGNISITENASNTSLEGMYVTGAIIGPNANAINELHINYCDFEYIECKMNNSSVHGSRMRAGGYANNMFYDGSYNTISNCYVINLSNLTSSVVENCTALNYVHNFYLTTLKNNILFSHPNSPYGQPGGNNSMNNNVYVNSCPYGCIGLMNYSNNIQLATGDLFANGFNFADMHLIANSTALTAGENGTQVGVYGGLFPYKEGAVPTNPHIFQKTISASTDSNGLLPVQISVRAENY